MNGRREVLMKVAMPVLVCRECDLQFPVNSSHFAEHFAILVC
jgi:hypothetical protein